jgi:hypothetical protein
VAENPPCPVMSERYRANLRRHYSPAELAAAEMHCCAMP